MNVSLKLFSSLMEYLPPNSEGNTVKISGIDQITCNQLIQRYKIPADSVRVVMVNGEFQALEARDQNLEDGDTISIWPAIQGG